MDTETQLFAGAAGVLAFVGMRIASAAYNRMVPRTPTLEKRIECASDDEGTSVRSSRSDKSLLAEDIPADLTKDLGPEFEQAEEQMTDISQQFQEISVKERETPSRKAAGRSKAAKDADASPRVPLARRTRNKPDADNVVCTAVPDPAPKRVTKKSAPPKSPVADGKRAAKKVEEVPVAQAVNSGGRRSRRNKENEVDMVIDDVIDVDQPIVDMEVEMRQPSSAKKQKPTRKKTSEAAMELAVDDAPKQTFCKLVDRSVEGMPIERHRALLSSSAIVSVRTLQNLLRDSVDAMPDDQGQLIELYLAKFHPDAAPASQGKPPGKRGAAPSQTEQDTPSPPKRSRRTPAKPLQPAAEPAPALPAKSPRGRAAAAAAGKAAPARESKAAAAARVEMAEGEEFELERNTFRVGGVLAEGADSRVYRGECVAGKHVGAAVAIKVQPRHCKTIFQITTEHHVLQKLQQVKDAELHVQTPLAYGCLRDQCYVLVTALLGPTLLSLVPASGSKAVGAADTLLAAFQGLKVLERVHAAGYVHRDIKPENLAVSHVGKGARLHVIDFGTAEALVDRNGKRKAQAQAIEGSLPYMSTSTLSRAPLGKRDDVESLLWTLLRLHQGALPWEHLSVKQAAQMRAMKEEWLRGDGDTSGLEPRVRAALLGLAERVRDLGPEDEPDYEGMRAVVRKSWQGAFPSAANQAYRWP